MEWPMVCEKCFRTITDIEDLREANEYIETKAQEAARLAAQQADVFSAKVLIERENLARSTVGMGLTSSLIRLGIAGSILAAGMALGSIITW